MFRMLCVMCYDELGLLLIVRFKEKIKKGRHDCKV